MSKVCAYFILFTSVISITLLYGSENSNNKISVETLVNKQMHGEWKNIEIKAPDSVDIIRGYTENEKNKKIKQDAESLLLLMKNSQKNNTTHSNSRFMKIPEVKYNALVKTTNKWQSQISLKCLPIKKRKRKAIHKSSSYVVSKKQKNNTSLLTRVVSGKLQFDPTTRATERPGVAGICSICHLTIFTTDCLEQAYSDHIV